MATAGRLIDTSIFDGACVAPSVRIPPGSPYNGPLLRVRRSSDNTEQDFYASQTDGNGNRWLDTTALLAFCGAGDGRVSAWYDRSGTGRNATQPVASSQPYIVVAGVLQQVGGRPMLVYGNAVSLYTPSISKVSQFAMLNAVIPSATTVQRQVSVGDNDSYVHYLGGTYPRLHQTLRSAVGVLAQPQSGAYVYTLVNDTVNCRTYVNGSLVNTAAVAGGYNTAAEPLVLFRASGDTLSEASYFQGSISDARRLAIERSQGLAFGITVA